MKMLEVIKKFEADVIELEDVTVSACFMCGRETHPLKMPGKLDEIVLRMRGVKVLGRAKDVASNCTLWGPVQVIFQKKKGN
jgi:hypothetical protein